MLLFAGHDPGSKNHIRPIFEHACQLGHDATYIDLANNLELIQETHAKLYIKNTMPNVFIGGSSLNQGEWALLRSCKQLAIPTTLYIDLSAKSKIDPIPPCDFPDKFITTNSGCLKELERFGADPDSLKLVGSTHLEQLAKDNGNRIHDLQTESYYGLTPTDQLVSFFCSPNTIDTLKALESLISVMPLTQFKNVLIIVRPHPRSSNKKLIESLCNDNPSLIFDSAQSVSNSELLNISICSLSMASTVSLESLVRDIPSAFYQIGWDYFEWDDLYSNIKSISRIRNLQQMSQFIDKVLTPSDQIKLDIENFHGALTRSWQIIEELIK